MNTSNISSLFRIILPGKLLVRFLYTKLINVHRLSLIVSGRWNPFTGLEQKPGSLVNYEVLMMHQARRQPTPSMAVRCYNVFSGVLGKREYIQQLSFLFKN